MDKEPVIIFLADDDLDDQDFFKHALKQIDESIICLTALNGEEAIKKLKTITPLPDYIFLDLNMPRMSGLKCLTEIKKMKSLKNVPVIIYSTSSEERDINEARKSGADYFVTKPFDFKELCDTLKHVISEDWNKEKA